MEVWSVYADCNQQLADFKWLESERNGFDIGREYAITRWVKEHWNGYVRSKLLEHLLGYRYWSELDRDDFGLLQRRFQDQACLVDRILDRLKVNQENLDIISWAQDWHIDINQVIKILEALDINSRRLAPKFDHVNF